ncbi:sensor histidine kinase [Leptothoe sp. ISB3NOV94-8A]
MSHTAVPISPKVRKIMRWVEWVILIQCVIDNVMGAQIDPRFGQPWQLALFVGMVAALSLRFPNQASLQQRRLYVALEMTLLIIAQFSRISFSSLFELFIIKACLLLPMSDAIIATVATTSIRIMQFTWGLPTAIEEVQLRGLDFYLNPQRILINTLTTAITVAVFVVTMGFLFASEQRNRYRAQILTQEVESLATQLERSRIARDIHDSLGHSLTTLDVQLALAQRYSQATNNSTKLQQTLETAQQLTVQCLTEVRQSLQTMRESNFELNTALHTLAEQLRSSFTINLDIKLPPLPQQLSYQLYLMAKEGLINVQKHAYATQTHLSMLTVDHQLVVTLHDNGCGFDIGTQSSGYGLQGIKERSQLLGGQFIINSGHQQGTTLLITIPLTTAA